MEMACRSNMVRLLEFDNSHFTEVGGDILKAWSFATTTSSYGGPPEMMQPSSLGMPSPTTILAHFMSSMQQPMSDASVTRRAWNANGFNVYAGKFKHTKLKNEKSFTKEELPNEEKSNGADLVDQIKKKYGFYQSYETNSAKMAENKLKENQTKLQNLANLEQPCSFKRIMGMVVIIMLVWQV